MIAVLNSTSYMDRIVTKVIYEVGMPVHAKGYHYVRMAILIKLADKSSEYESIGNLYLDVAVLFHTTAECVERDIRYSISVAWERNRKKFAHSIFGDRDTKTRPTNSEFIAAVVEAIKLKLGI